MKLQYHCPSGAVTPSESHSACFPPGVLGISPSYSCLSRLLIQPDNSRLTGGEEGRALAVPGPPDPVKASGTGQWLDNRTHREHHSFSPGSQRGCSEEHPQCSSPMPGSVCHRSDLEKTGTKSPGPRTR